MKEEQLLNGKADLEHANESIPIDFIEFFKTFAETKPDTNYRIAHDHFKDFYKKAVLPISKVDYELSERFMNYLISLEITRNTAQHYLAAYKATLNQAVKLRKIEYNPAKLLTIKFERKSIERLTFEELQLLKDTYCKYNDIKNGFYQQTTKCMPGTVESDLLINSSLCNPIS